MAKKHKKKVYTKPKKLTHVHQNVSLSKFIESINNPKCKLCQSLLAVHDNRFYCGKCHLTNFGKTL